MNIIQECNEKYPKMTLKELEKEYNKLRSKIIPKPPTLESLNNLTRFELCIIHMDMKDIEKLKKWKKNCSL